MTAPVVHSLVMQQLNSPSRNSVNETDPVLGLETLLLLQELAQLKVLGSILALVCVFLPCLLGDWPVSFHT